MANVQNVLDELDGEWARFEEVVPTNTRETAWRIARDCGVNDPYYADVLARHYASEHADEALAFVIASAASQQASYVRHRGLAGWCHSYEWLIERVHDDDPALLAASLPLLPPHARDFAMVVLNADGDIPQSAQRFVAAAWASSYYDEDWFELRHQLDLADWHALVIDVVCAPGFRDFDWERIQDAAATASTAQRVTLLLKDGSEHRRSHAWVLFADLDVAGFHVLRDALGAISPQTHDAHSQRAALVHALIWAYGRARRDIPDDLIDGLLDDLTSSSSTDLEATEAALDVLPAAERERLLIAALEDESAHLPRAFHLAGRYRTELVWMALAQRAAQVEGDSFGSAARAAAQDLLDRWREEE